MSLSGHADFPTLMIERCKFFGRGLLVIEYGSDQAVQWLRSFDVLQAVIDDTYGNPITPIPPVSHFRDVAMYRLTDPEAAQYRQVVLFGLRRTRHERERLTDRDFQTQRSVLSNVAAAYAKITPLGDAADRTYTVPAGPASVRLTYSGLPLDAIEDLLPSSRAYREAVRSVFAPPMQVAGRPLTPLTEGHAGILSCSGLLNGVFGRGELRHVAYWQTGKKVDHIEEIDERGVTTIRDRERFTQSLTLIYADGRVAELSEENDAKRTPTLRQA